MIYFLSVLASFCATFLKGFQHKNVIHRRMQSVFFTSFLMQAFDVATTGIIVYGVNNGTWWIVMLTGGTGAAMGMISAITFHERIFQWWDARRSRHNAG